MPRDGQSSGQLDRQLDWQVKGRTVSFDCSCLIYLNRERESESYTIFTFWEIGLTRSEVEVERTRHKSILQLKRIEVRLCPESESDIFMFAATIILFL